MRIVMWYAARQWTLWVLLIAMPLIMLFAAPDVGATLERKRASFAGCPSHSWVVDLYRAAPVGRCGNVHRRCRPRDCRHPHAGELTAHIRNLV